MTILTKTLLTMTLLTMTLLTMTLVITLLNAHYIYVLITVISKVIYELNQL